MAGERVGWGVVVICSPPRRYAMSDEKVLTKEIAEQLPGPMLTFESQEQN